LFSLFSTSICCIPCGHRGLMHPRRHCKLGTIYSQTSLYRTRIIRTSAYIEITLLSRPPAIVTGGKMHQIYRTRVYQILCYIEYAVPPHTSTAASFISKSIYTSNNPSVSQSSQCAFSLRSLSANVAVYGRQRPQ